MPIAHSRDRDDRSAVLDTHAEEFAAAPREREKIRGNAGIPTLPGFRHSNACDDSVRFLKVKAAPTSVPTLPTPVAASGTLIAYEESVAMYHAPFRLTDEEPALLDEQMVMTILSRHFPAAASDAIRQAAEDVLLLEMLLRDEGVVWEDAMNEQPDGARAVTFLRAENRRRS